MYFSQDAGTVTEGQDIEFIITQDLISDDGTFVDIEFEYTGDFFNPMPMATTRVNFPAGGFMAKITIPTDDDNDAEANGSLKATIMPQTGETSKGSILRLGTPAVRTVTILNDDVPAISFDPAVYTIVEGTTRTITLRAEPPPGIKTQIELTTRMETTIPDNDYQLSTTIITFEPNQSTASFEVSIPARTGFQGNLELHLSFDLLNPENSTTGTVSVAVINIKDDSAPIASLEIMEGNSDLEERDSDSVTLRVTLDRVFDQETTIQIVTGGTATLGEDYTIDNQVVTLLRNNTSVETILEVINDNLVEPTETIILRLDAHNNRIIDDTDLFDRNRYTDD